MRKHQVKVISLLAALTLTVISTVAVLHGRAQNGGRVRVQDEEATPIQEGVMTEKQKKHSKLFKHPGRKLRDIAANQAGDVEVQVDSGLEIRLPESGPQSPVLESAICNADAVIVGALDSKSAQLTEDGRFIFTDYEVTVKEIIKNNPSAPIELNKSITITREGGAVQINGRVFRAKREDFKATFVGKQYLLFLKSIPEMDSYLAYGNGTFQLDGVKVIALSDTARQELLQGDAIDAETFLSKVRAFAAADRGQKPSSVK